MPVPYRQLFSRLVRELYAAGFHDLSFVDGEALRKLTREIVNQVTNEAEGENRQALAELGTPEQIVEHLLADLHGRA
ncbi:MAG: hypothetical protein ACFCD0_24670 [Gemmataceae bacterium]